MTECCGQTSVGVLRIASICSARYQTGRWSAVSTCGGILGGLVSITAGCGNVRPFSAVIIGCIGHGAWLASRIDAVFPSGEVFHVTAPGVLLGTQYGVSMCIDVHP